MKEVNKRNNILILFKLIPLEKGDYIFIQAPPPSLRNPMLFMNRSSHVFNLSFILRKTCFLYFTKRFLTSALNKFHAQINKVKFFKVRLFN